MTKKYTSMDLSELLDGEPMYAWLERHGVTIGKEVPGGFESLIDMNALAFGLCDLALDALNKFAVE
jgi:hypothetical protein